MLWFAAPSVRTNLRPLSVRPSGVQDMALRNLFSLVRPYVLAFIAQRRQPRGQRTQARLEPNQLESWGEVSDSVSLPLMLGHEGYKGVWSFIPDTQESLAPL